MFALPIFCHTFAMQSARCVQVGAGVLLLLSHLLPTPQNGNLAGLPTLCPLKVLTAMPCPGCGVTRSLVFSAHADWPSAFAFHPLGPIIYGALWLVLASGVLSLWRKPRAISQRVLICAGSTFGTTLLILWIIRLTGVLPFPANF